MAALIAFAPLITYFYQFAIRLVGLPFFTTGERNGLLLSVVNSMMAFGNNTFALAAILCCWRRCGAGINHNLLAMRSWPHFCS